jgi:thioredoxin 1
MTSPVLDVVCLCAAWCGTCGSYADTFQALSEALPGHRYRWIDIEDEADLVGDIDVETFPTLMVAHQGQVLFAGPVLPRLGDAQRLVEVQVQAQVASVAHMVRPAKVASGLVPDQLAAFTSLAQKL